MKLGLLTRNPSAWCSSQLRAAMERRGVESYCFSFRELVVRAGGRPKVSLKGLLKDASELSAIIVRPIGRGSLDEVIFRLDSLHILEEEDVLIVNPPSTIEKAVDKLRALHILESQGVSVPKTMAVEDPAVALDVFDELGGMVVVKPLFGSRGLGITVLSDREIARRVFNTLSYFRHTLYLQQFLPHGDRDIRAFVVGGRVVAAMYRVGGGWKTNISMGAKPVSFKPGGEVEELAVKAAEALGCMVAGVDLMRLEDGRLVVHEVNSQPGFRGLQSVSKVNIAQKIVDYVIEKARR